MSLQITLLREEHIQDAAALVCARYRALRESAPILPSRYAEVNTIAGLLRDLAGEADGVVATQDSRLVGFLWGLVIPSFLGKRTTYSPDWANAAELGESRRIYAEMYGHLAARWVADGCFTHVVSMMGHDREGIEGWQWLGFGLCSVDGVRELRPVTDDVAEVEIRRASVEEAGEVTALDRALRRHLAATPTFWIHEPQDYAEWVREPGNAAWLAYERGVAVGYMALEPGDSCECQFLQDEKTVNIGGAFTQENARGRGIATALLNRSLEWAQAEGYARCAVDFETMNTLAARFWTRWFDPVSYSLMRRIDERIGTWQG